MLVESAAKGATARADVVRSLGPLEMMRPAEREHGGWLTSAEDFRRAGDGPPWRMDAFYRAVRRRTGILMKGPRPEGGQWSFDAENRRPWRGDGDPPAPDAPTFRSDDVTDEVADLVRTRFGDHPGGVDTRALPASQSQVARLWDWARETCVPQFGPF